LHGLGYAPVDSGQSACFLGHMGGAAITYRGLGIRAARVALSDCPVNRVKQFLRSGIRVIKIHALICGVM